MHDTIACDCRRELPEPISSITRAEPGSGDSNATGLTILLGDNRVLLLVEAVTFFLMPNRVMTDGLLTLVMCDCPAIFPPLMPLIRCQRTSLKKR